ncbi:hypothetical protein BDZ45DRAFT_500088 [Acephala macrosclerotiorum]|nr:hypothetical protein BDZ45DRAFT_500088 [Acephala macrosclerotiorum]
MFSYYLELDWVAPVLFLAARSLQSRSEDLHAKVPHIQGHSPGPRSSRPHWNCSRFHRAFPILRREPAPNEIIRYFQNPRPWQTELSL